MKEMTLQKIADACGGTYVGAEDKLNTEIAGITIDSRKAEPGFLFIAVRGERTDGHSYIPSVFAKGVACCISEETLEHPAGPYIQVSSSLQAIKDIAEYYRSTLTIPVIGISGSVGKTSTKEMIAAVLNQKYKVLKTEGNFNNEIGLPLTVFNIREEHEAAVLEMGISDFGEMTRLSKIARPDICVLTNIGLCHLEFLKDRDGILKAKTEMFDYAMPGARIIVNGDDDKLITLKDTLVPVPTFFGLKKGNDFYAEGIENLGLDGVKCTIKNKDASITVTIPIPGIHMVSNALAGAAVGSALGLTLEEIKAGIESLIPVSGRNHIIHALNWTILDDCYNANPISMCASLDVISNAIGRRVAILGDMGELGADEESLHHNVGCHAADNKVDLLICVGPLSKHILTGAKSRNPGLAVSHFNTKEDLLTELPHLLEKGDSILVKASHFMQFEKVVEYLQETGQDEK